MIDNLTLPSLRERYLLSEKQIESFQKKGHVLLESVASSEEIKSDRVS